MHSSPEGQTARSLGAHALEPFHPADVPPDSEQHVSRGVWTFTDAQFRPLFAKPWDNRQELRSTYGLVKFHPLPDVAALVALLALLKTLPDTCIMRGQFVGGAADVGAWPAGDEFGRAGKPKRRSGFARKSGEYWRDEPNRLFRMDVDGHPVPDALTDLQAAWEPVLETLPEELSAAHLVVSPSSKAGAPRHMVSDPNALRGHVLALLAEPRTLAEQGTWAERIREVIPEVDTGIYSPAGLLRTAAPNTCGYPDPLEGRRGPFVSRGQSGERAALPATPPGTAPSAPRRAFKQGASELAEWEALTEAEKAATIADLTDALKWIPADDRKTWVDVGHDIRAGLPDEVGRPLWEAWSRTADNCDEDDLQRFEGFNPSQTHYRMIFTRAKSYCWPGARRVPAPIDPALFGRSTPDALPAKVADVEVVTMPAATPRTVVGPVTREQQLAMFAGCVLVVSGKKDSSTVLTAAGQSLTKSQFDAKFGGYEFMLGGFKSSTTKSAYDAFSGNQDIGFPRADAHGFRPQLPFQALFTEDGLTMVNTYRALGRRQPGDATPMLEHVRRLFPVGDDATIVLSALAAMVQYPGRKFTWCLVLQSGPGAGKNMIGYAMATALGDKYVTLLDDEDLRNKFNAWLADNLLCVFPELPARAAARALEKLKTLITDGRRQGVERKNADKIGVNVCANFLFLTNHKDAVRKDANDRRFCVLYSAIQTASDLARAGMGSSYFRALAGWLANGGEAIFANWLAEFDIPEQYDPTKGAHVAPATSSTAQAIELGRSDIAQAIAEAIEDEEPGFVGELISWGMAKARALHKLRAGNVTEEGVRNALTSLGFERWGKTDNVVLPDGKKTTLYLRSGIDLGGMSNAAIAKMYSNAQDAAGTAQRAAAAGVGR